MSDLSLFDIERGLHEMVSVWQEAQTPEEIALAEETIRAYVCAEIRKVDGIRKYIRACDHQVTAAKIEMNCQAQRVRMWEARRDRLKAFVFDAMQSFGVKKLEGQTGSLSIKGNGGKQALSITDASMVPEELCIYSGSIPGSAWARIKPVLESSGIEARMARMPDNEAIRRELSVRCDHCDGAPAVGTKDECQWCNGLGTMPVAGARLESRGSHLEVR